MHLLVLFLMMEKSQFILISWQNIHCMAERNMLVDTGTLKGHLTNDVSD